MRHSPFSLCILLILVCLVLASCAGESPELDLETQAEISPGDEPIEEAEESFILLGPCDVTSEMVGEEMKVAGQIEFIDRGDPQGLFIGLFDRGCLLGVFLEKALFESWTAARQAEISEGSQAEFSGILTMEMGEPVLEVIAEEVAPDTAADEGTGEIARVEINVGEDGESRWQEISIRILDEDGQPVIGVPISIAQSDIDFFHSTSNTVWAAWVTEDGGWSEDAEEQIQLYRDMGTNNWEFLPWWSWDLYEPADNQWDFYSYTNDWHFTDRPYWQEFFPDVRFNTMWVGPQFNRTYMLPDWVDYENDEAFRAEFGEYIREAVRLNPTGHFDLYGLTVEINDWPIWEKGAWEISDEEWDWAIEFIAWEAELIRSIDPDARISIDFDIARFFDDCQPCQIENWIERIIAAGIDFDVIGMEFHPGGVAGEPETVEEFAAFTETLDVYGKDYYIWEFAVRSHGEPVQELVLGEMQFPSVDEYTEEYQSQTYVEFLRYFIENPRFLGVRYLKYVDGVTDEESEHEFSTALHASSGILRADRTPKPAYYAIRDYFRSLLVTGAGQTDESGSFTFSAIPGIFEISLDGESRSVHLGAGMELVIED